MIDLIGFYPKLARQGVFKGVNFNHLVARFWRLESMGSAGAVCPTVVWHAHKNPARSMAYPAAQHIDMRCDPLRSIEWISEALIHELAHCALPQSDHRELFCRHVIACVEEAFGLSIDTGLLALPRGHRACRAYAIDDALVEIMIAARVGARLREEHPAGSFLQMAAGRR